MKIKLDRKDSENEENGEGRPRTHPGPFYDEQEGPKTQEYEKENPSLRKERKIKMAGVDPKSVDDEDGNERKTKGSAHLRLKRISVLTGC